MTAGEGVADSLSAVVTCHALLMNPLPSPPLPYPPPPVPAPAPICLFPEAEGGPLDAGSRSRGRLVNDPSILLRSRREFPGGVHPYASSLIISGARESRDQSRPTRAAAAARTRNTRLSYTRLSALRPPSCPFADGVLFSSYIPRPATTIPPSLSSPAAPLRSPRPLGERGTTPRRRLSCRLVGGVARQHRRNK